jgi:hypothetical protein
MTYIYEVTLRCKNRINPVHRITYRVVGETRESAVKIAMDLAGPDYEEAFIIAGPRHDYYNAE